MDKFCYKCGAELKEGVRFCYKCGANILNKNQQSNNNSGNVKVFDFVRVTLADLIGDVILSPIIIAIEYLICYFFIKMILKVQDSSLSEIPILIISGILTLIAVIFIIITILTIITSLIDFPRKLAAFISPPKIMIVNDTLFYPKYFYTDGMIRISDIRHIKFEIGEDLVVILDHDRKIKIKLSNMSPENRTSLISAIRAQVR